jgi:hypothetical protein
MTANEQEPVAWKHKPSGMIFDEIIEAANPDDLVPLYTHPAKEELDTRSYLIGRYDSAKTLTDEEIESAYWSLVGKQHQGKIASYLYSFAKDILQKASEK